MPTICCTMNKIELFVPEKINPTPLNEDELRKHFGSVPSYASKGRWALDHILTNMTQNSLNNKVLIPAYICESVKDVLREKKLQMVFYDLDIDDLNPSVDSIKTILDNENDVLAVIVPSFYGNPANLFEIEKLCKSRKVYLIDDSAQSCGAMIDGKMTGAFGDAGLISFSPGKSSAAHMGALYVNVIGENEFERRHTRHIITHWITYKKFYYERENIYNKNIFAIITYSLLGKVLYRLVDVRFDNAEKFENKLLGGAYKAAIDNKKIRVDIRKRLIANIPKSNKIRPIENIRGEASPCKVVIWFDDVDICTDFKSYLENVGVKYYGGYNPKEEEFHDLENTKIIVNHVVELPIELNGERMDYLETVLKKYDGFKNILL